MGTRNRYTLLGVYVSETVAEALEERVYDEAGVVDLMTYFDPETSSVPSGDPGADATNEILQAILDTFAALYDDARFDAVDELPTDSFDLVHLAATPETVASLRERFQAAATIQESDLRTVHTAIFESYLETPS